MAHAQIAAAPLQLVVKHCSIAQATKHDQRPQPRDYRAIGSAVGLERGRQRSGETVQAAAVTMESGEERLEPVVRACLGVVGNILARAAQRFGLPPFGSPGVEAEPRGVEQGNDVCKRHVGALERRRVGKQ